MTQKRKKGLSKTVATVISLSLAAVIAIALLITNIFIPVKYLFAYFVTADKNKPYAMRVTFVNVGYGDCTAVEFPDGKVMLVDGGDGSYYNQLKIFTELNARGIEKIDYLLCTSVSEERCGGLAEILKYKTAEKVYAPYYPVTYLNEGFRSFREAVKEFEIIEYGAGVFNDEYGYNFCVLSPSAHDLSGGEYDILAQDPSTKNINDASAVIWIEYCGKAFLLCGNVSSEIQDKLIEKFQKGLEIDGRTLDLSRCTVIKVPNHGSYFAANAELYDAAKPEYAVLSVGDNGFGNPTAQALSLAQGCVGENIYRTDTDGTVVFTVTDGGITVKKEKV